MRITSKLLIDALKLSLCCAGVCQCDVGYSGTACEVATTSPAASIKETFDDGDVLSAAKWSWFGGGVISTHCGVASSGHAAVFKYVIGRTIFYNSPTRLSI